MATSPKVVYDLAVIGGGIVGLATARQAMIRYPKLAVCVLEKEQQLAIHQSHRNSGVVHAGVYYKKGSMKSKFCIKGAKLIQSYCREKNLPYKQVGKLIVATDEHQLDRLHALHNNAKNNRVEGIELISADRIQSIQPGCSKAIEALWSPTTAIVNWRQVALSFANDFKSLGGTIYTDFAVRGLEQGPVKSILIRDGEKTVRAKAVVNCAGLLSGLVARMTGNSNHPGVVPFKGRYYLLSDKLASSINTNIYPVPDPDLPFLGVHITPRIDGSVLIGPTATLQLNHERYVDANKFRLISLFDIVFYTGMLNLIRKPKNIKAGFHELKRWASKRILVNDVRQFLPDIADEDVIDSDFCGIRAQSVTKDGELVDDFLLEPGFYQEFRKVLHVRNAASPAATSSLAMADRIINDLEARYL